MLEAVFEGGGGFDLATQTDLDPDAEAQRRVGGPVNLKPGEPLTVSMAVPAPRAACCQCVPVEADTSCCQRHAGTCRTDRPVLGHLLCADGCTQAAPLCVPLRAAQGWQVR